MAAAGSRKFGEAITAFLGKKVSVETSEGRIYLGRLEAVDEKLNVMLEDVEGSDASHIILNGTFVKEVKLVERPVDIHALADKLSKIFPGLVKVRDDIAAVIVMDKIRVTQSGVVEGSGLAAEKVKAIYEEFVKETG